MEKVWGDLSKVILSFKLGKFSPTCSGTWNGGWAPFNPLLPTLNHSLVHQLSSETASPRRSHYLLLIGYWSDFLLLSPASRKHWPLSWPSFGSLFSKGTMRKHPQLADCSHCHWTILWDGLYVDVKGSCSSKPDISESFQSKGRKEVLQAHIQSLTKQPFEYGTLQIRYHQKLWWCWRGPCEFLGWTSWFRWFIMPQGERNHSASLFC